ncbi:unnamed protein product [Vitrella brassicaformis CCMP3155]|uniref:Uncharacterized protein n=2 Tax=Vitrella brassicaformis TaxID=1169539 RepID=A0A0G4EEW1_VITBC|nr:unnamed protein product [Vitrella brassicaformis CCMP3155]|eukprot:CEL94233.1 unnamed protein product [Vitrella brassicaformis CCMP3155]
MFALCRISKPDKDDELLIKGSVKDAAGLNTWRPPEARTGKSDARRSFRRHRRPEEPASDSAVRKEDGEDVRGGDKSVGFSEPKSDEEDKKPEQKEHVRFLTPGEEAPSAPTPSSDQPTRRGGLKKATGAILLAATLAKPQQQVPQEPGELVKFDALLSVKTASVNDPALPLLQAPVRVTDVEDPILLLGGGRRRRKRTLREGETEEMEALGLSGGIDGDSNQLFLKVQVQRQMEEFVRTYTPGVMLQKLVGSHAYYRRRVYLDMDRRALVLQGAKGASRYPFSEMMEVTLDNRETIQEQGQRRGSVIIQRRGSVTRSRTYVESVVTVNMRRVPGLLQKKKLVLVFPTAQKATDFAACVNFLASTLNPHKGAGGQPSQRSMQASAFTM